MSKILLQVESLTKTFSSSSGFWFKRNFNAVENISFTLQRQKTLAIVGENGSGKSTLAKMIVGITQPSSGKIYFKNQELNFGDYRFRSQHIRMIFQDPNASFNMQLNVGQTLDLPLRLATLLSEDERDQKIAQVLRLIGLTPEHVNIRLSELNISQKQRIALARAIILDPEVIIIDDMLNTLDASMRAALINLLLDLQTKLGLAYIYIGQNLGIIKHIADDILLLQQGKMIEYGATKEVLLHPQADLTKRLIISQFGKELDESAWQ